MIILRRSYIVLILGVALLIISLASLGTLGQSVFEQFPSTVFLMSSETIAPKESSLSPFYYLAEREVNVIIKLSPRDAPVAVKVLGPDELIIEEAVFNDLISIPINSSNPIGAYYVTLFNFDDRDVVVNAVVTSDDFSDVEDLILPLAQSVIYTGIIFITGIIVIVIGFVLFLLEWSKRKSE